MPLDIILTNVGKSFDPGAAFLFLDTDWMRVNKKKE